MQTFICNIISSSKIINYAIIFVLILTIGLMIYTASACFKFFLKERKYIMSEPLMFFHFCALELICLIGILWLPMMIASLL